MSSSYAYQPLATESDLDENELRSIPHNAKGNRKQQSSFDRLFLRRLFRILRVIFLNSEGNICWIFLAFVTISCIKEITVYYTGTIASKFYVVLVGKDWEAFKPVVTLSILIVLIAALAKSLLKFIGGLFALAMRRILTNNLQRRYVHAKTFYQLLKNFTDVDNPDQRITQDVDKFSEALRLICENILVSPLLIAYYTYLCWSLSGYEGPLLIYAYFIGGFITARFFIAPIVNLVYMKEYHEGNFRYLHVRIRQFVESIAFSLGERAEVQRLDNRLQSLLYYQRQIIDKELSLQTITEIFSYFGSVLTYLIIAIPIFTHKYDDIGTNELSGIISLNAFFSIYLIHQFTVIVEQSTRITDLAGYTARIGRLLEAISEVNNGLDEVNIDPPYDGQLINAELSIEFDQVSIHSPNGKLLVSELKFLIEQEKNVMIIGPNGSGKTSILRVMGGLWPATKGRVILPHGNRQKTLLYLPQIPYLAFGSLRDQITYPMINPDNVISVTDEEIRKLLVMVNLSHLERVVDSFDTQYGQDWEKMLTPGECQKLAFARLFFWKPVFAALDEATSSLDTNIETQLLESCKELGITCITVSHNKNLLQFHDKVLLLDGKGRYATSDIDIDGSGNVERWIESTLRTFA